MKMPNNFFHTHNVLVLQKSIKIVNIVLQLKLMTLAIYLSNQCSEASDWDF